MNRLLNDLSGKGNNVVTICDCDGVLVLCDDLLVRDCRNYIKDTISERELLELMAEECAELAKASLKCIRTRCLSNNPTHTSKADSEMNFIEEQLDVMSILWLLTEDKMYEHIKNYPKYVRWAKRLGYEIPEKYIVERGKA